MGGNLNLLWYPSSIELNQYYDFLRMSSNNINKRLSKVTYQVCLVESGGPCYVCNSILKYNIKGWCTKQKSTVNIFWLLGARDRLTSCTFPLGISVNKFLHLAVNWGCHLWWITELSVVGAIGFCWRISRIVKTNTGGTALCWFSFTSNISNRTRYQSRSQKLNSDWGLWLYADSDLRCQRFK